MKYVFWSLKPLREREREEKRERIDENFYSVSPNVLTNPGIANL